MTSRYFAVLASGCLILAPVARAQASNPDEWDSPFPAKAGQPTDPAKSGAEAKPAPATTPAKPATPRPLEPKPAPAAPPPKPAPAPAPARSTAIAPTRPAETAPAPTTAAPTPTKPAETAPDPEAATTPPPKPAPAAAPAPSPATPSAATAATAARTAPVQEEQQPEEATVISTQERFLPGSEPHSPGTWGRAFADPRNLRHTPGTVGGLGLIRVGSADLGMPGLLRFSGYGDYFLSRNFPVLDATNVHSTGTFAISYIPFDFLEAYLAYSATANTNSLTSPRLLEALGDVAVGLKASHEWAPGFYAGLDLRLLSFSGVGSQDVRGYGIGFAPTLLGVYDFRALAASFPLRVYLNAGFVLDGSKDLVRQHTLTAGEEFALGINRFDRVTAGAGFEV